VVVECLNENNSTVPKEPTNERSIPAVRDFDSAASHFLGTEQDQHPSQKGAGISP
jgi:hypothetical protein